MKRGRRRAEAEHAWEWLSDEVVSQLASALGERPGPMQVCIRCRCARKGNRLLRPGGPRFADVVAQMAGCDGAPRSFVDPCPLRDLSDWPLQNIDDRIRSVRAALILDVYTNPGDAERFLRALWLAHRVVRESSLTLTYTRALRHEGRR
jgi:hypothetical protein